MKVIDKYRKWKRTRDMVKDMARAVENRDLVVSGFHVRGIELVGMQNVRIYNGNFDTGELIVTNGKRPYMILTHTELPTTKKEKEK